MLAAALFPWTHERAEAQVATRALQACTIGTLQNCAHLRFTTSPGTSTGITLLAISVSNLGSIVTPSLPTSVYNFVFLTGLAPATTSLSALVAPIATGGATITDPSSWDVFDSGDAIFLSALTNNGVGNCVVGAPESGFGQAGNTCGIGQTFLFGYETPHVFDVMQFSIANMEVVGLDPTLPADSCGDPNTPCLVTESVPEPATMLLVASGLLCLAVPAVRRRFR